MSAATVLRAGFSRANTAVPPRNLSPVLALVADDLLTLGFATDLNPHWRFGFALEHQLKHVVTDTNPALPFGPDAKESNQAILLTLTLMLSRRWQGL